MKTREKLEEFVKQAAASETKVDIITTIDYNPISGMSRIAREILADIIVLDWPDRTNFFERLLGEKIDSIISNTDKTLFICHFENRWFHTKEWWLLLRHFPNMKTDLIYG